MAIPEICLKVLEETSPGSGLWEDVERCEPAWIPFEPVNNIPPDWELAAEKRIELNLLVQAAAAADALPDSNPARPELVDLTLRALEAAVLDLGTTFDIAFKRG
jgi:hypothetical protein